MKKACLGFFIMAVLGGCIKNDTTSQPNCSPITIAAPANEIASLKAYLDSNKISYTQDSRGFFYSIFPAGSSDTSHPSVCSAVSTTYLGTFLNGNVFDSTSVTNPASFTLGSVITGWQEAIPLMKLNDSMNLYLPPTLGYGAYAYGPVPGNSNLVFRIKLLAFD